MPALANTPTQEFQNRTEMLADIAAAPWHKRRWVVILRDEDHGDNPTLSLFTQDKLIFIKQANEPGAIQIPAGGQIGQILAKAGDEDYAMEWINKPADPVQIPIGGTTGQVLAKSSDADHEFVWIDPPEGGGGPVVDNVFDSGDFYIKKPSNDYFHISATDDLSGPLEYEVVASPPAGANVFELGYLFIAQPAGGYLKVTATDELDSPLEFEHLTVLP